MTDLKLKSDIIEDLFSRVGCNNQDTGECSHAEGKGTEASGPASHAEGGGTKANGIESHAEGENTEAIGGASHAEGMGIMVEGKLIPTTASGLGSHAEGGGTTANGTYSHAEGKKTEAFGAGCHAEGIETKAEGWGCHAEGFQTTAGLTSDNPEYTVLGGCYSHAEGKGTKASGWSSHVEGEGTEALGTASHAEGFHTIAGRKNDEDTLGENYSHAEGKETEAIAEASHAEGKGTSTCGISSHAEGIQTEAEGVGSHAEGRGCRAVDNYCHAEGQGTIARTGLIYQHLCPNHDDNDGYPSHAEGYFTEARGEASHAEGYRTKAMSIGSHAEGGATKAGWKDFDRMGGYYAHAEGWGTIAEGYFSHSEGLYTTIEGFFPGAHIMGRFGKANRRDSWFLANGLSDNQLGLAAKILENGDAGFDGKITTGPGSADYAEMFETVDGKSIEPGYFVTLDDKKIRKANEKDDYILGVTSATPSVVGNSGELRWKDKFTTDEWGRVQYQDVVVPAVKDKEGKIIIPERTEKQHVLNPEWDNTKEYISRLKRPEWAAVGLLGQILIRDDGTCQVNGCCRPNEEGIATASKEGYRVMERTGANQILILFR